MDEFLVDLITLIDAQKNIIEIDSLAKLYVEQILLIDENNIEYIEILNNVNSKMKKYIYRENKRFTEDKLDEPFILKGSSNNLLSKSKTFKFLKGTINILTEDSHDFSDRVGVALLKKIGCSEKNIHITQKSVDQGIDFWGKLEFDNILGNQKSFILIIGQVKRYNVSVPVEHLRSFVGAIETALESGFFGDGINSKTPYLAQFVATGNITKEGMNVAKMNNINIISKRNLEVMGILDDNIKKV